MRRVLSGRTKSYGHVSNIIYNIYTYTYANLNFLPEAYIMVTSVIYEYIMRYFT